MEQLYLCRHGETEWSLSGQHTSTSDIPLTEKGKAQSAHLKERLQKVHFEKVFTSPMQRASMTCQLVGFEGILEPDAMEWNYGDYEGITTKVVHQTNPTWNLFKNGAPGGETVEQVVARADRFLQKLAQCKGKVAVFSHGHFLRVLAARYLGLGGEEAKLFALSVASISILGLERKQPVIILWNETGS